MKPGKQYTIGEFAAMTAVTERTLRYYDRIGLLKPSAYNAQGHRMYTLPDLRTLQMINTLKYVDYSLEEIAHYLQRPNPGFRASLAEQYELLAQKKRHIEQVMEQLERLRQIVPYTPAAPGNEPDVSDEINEESSSFLIMLLHSLRHEQFQRQWLSERVSPELIQTIFMEGMGIDERLKFEQQMASKLQAITALHRTGVPHKDARALAAGRELLLLLDQVLGGKLAGLMEGSLLEDSLLEDSLMKDSLMKDSLLDGGLLAGGSGVDQPPGQGEGTEPAMHTLVEWGQGQGQPQEQGLGQRQQQATREGELAELEELAGLAELSEQEQMLFGDLLSEEEAEYLNQLLAVLFAEGEGSASEPL